MRVDANVSVHQKDEPWGIRTEIKNIGSVRGVASAIRFEIDRQIKVKESGGLIVNETRAWDALSKSTVAMRDKEQQQDYRYMPEPNLPPLHVSMGVVQEGCVNADDIKKTLPELPEATRSRLQENFALTLEQAVVLVNDDPLLKLFNAALKSRQINAKLLVNFLINDFSTLINKENVDLCQMYCKSIFWKM